VEGTEQLFYIVEETDGETRPKIIRPPGHAAPAPAPASIGAALPQIWRASFPALIRPPPEFGGARPKNIRPPGPTAPAPAPALIGATLPQILRASSPALIRPPPEFEGAKCYLTGMCEGNLYEILTNKKIILIFL
jgi:hypothetical protein